MGALEEKVLQESFKPKTYIRYVDDIFVAIPNENYLKELKR